VAASKARDDAGYASITMKSPVGVLTLIADAKHLVAVQWKNDAPPPLPRARRQPDHLVLLEARQQLTRYFEGAQRDFSVPVRYLGTDFQQRVWVAIRKIPFGVRSTYRDVAAAIGQPAAARAVGAAVGKNALFIIVPDQRVLTSAGTFHGTPQGKRARRILLEFEERVAMATS
jgi:methylated-DNA-[protein]-cysteine S-methyltransferase